MDSCGTVSEDTLWRATDKRGNVRCAGEKDTDLGRVGALAWVLAPKGTDKELIGTEWRETMGHMGYKFTKVSPD